MLPDDIDDVLAQLTAIIDRSLEKESRTGYFPAYYREVTRRVKEGIEGGRFEDAERMERFDVAFANMYLRAMEDRKQDDSPPRSWQVSFEAAGHWSPLLLQHLLLGMNAHINLDLGMAANEVTADGDVEELKSDFFEINEVLGEMIDAAQRQLNELSPWMRCLDWLGGEADEVISNFCLRAARTDAWRFARELDGAGQPRRTDLIRRKDQATAERAKRILNPGGTWAKPILLAARLREPFDPRIVIQTLSDWS